MKPQTIRPFRPEDAPACGEIIEKNALFRQYAWSGASAARALLAALDDPLADLKVSETEGPEGTPEGTKKLLGFAWFVRKACFHRSGYLRLIAVHPDAQGQGTGKALLEPLEAAYGKEGGIFLLVTSTNAGARRFYESLGYQFLGTIPSYVKSGIDECIYYKAPPSA